MWVDVFGVRGRWYGFRGGLSRSGAAGRSYSRAAAAGRWIPAFAGMTWVGAGMTV